MGTITTAIVPDHTPRNFASPGSRTGGSAPTPIQRVIFSGTSTIPAKISTDISFVTITATLPRLFFYRIVSLEIGALSNSTIVFTDFQPVMSVRIRENAVQQFQFLLRNFFLDGGSTFESGPLDDPAITNDIGTSFVGDPHSHYLIDATKGVSDLIVRWLDISADATAAVDVFVRIEFDQFTVQQANQAPLNYSLLTYL